MTYRNHPHLRAVAKTVLEMILKTLNSYIRKEERSQPDNVSFTLGN